MTHPLHHQLTHNAFKFISKKITIHQTNRKTIERILFHVLNIMVTNKTQVISSNFFVLALKISDLVPRISSALRRFPVFLCFFSDFPRLLDAQRKVLKLCINVQKNLTKLLNGLLDLPFYWVAITSIFRSSDTSFLY